MAQITEAFVLDMMTACERKEHPPLTVHEAQQLLHAWREREALRKDAERYRWLRHGDNDERCIRLTSEGQPYMLRAALLDRCIDEAIADDVDEAAHTVAVPVVGAA